MLKSLRQGPMASRLDQIREALVVFTRLETPPALIEGLALLVGKVGVQRLPAPADPIQAWIDLMEVVRMLRPAGIPRRPNAADGQFLL